MAGNSIGMVNICFFALTIFPEKINLFGFALKITTKKKWMENVKERNWRLSIFNDIKVEFYFLSKHCLSSSNEFPMWQYYFLSKCIFFVLCRKESFYFWFFLTWIFNSFSLSIRHGANPVPFDGGISPVLAILDKLMEYEDKVYPYQLCACLNLLLLAIPFIELPYKVNFVIN